MVLSPAGLWPERDIPGEAKQQRQITDPSCRQRRWHKITTPQLSKENLKEKEKLVTALIVAWHQDRLAEWLSVVRDNFDFDFGGGLEYLHCSHANQQEENPVPGGITGSPCSWGV
jgi:hypothetical protein